MLKLMLLSLFLVTFSCKTESQHDSLVGKNSQIKYCDNAYIQQRFKDGNIPNSIAVGKTLLQPYLWNRGNLIYRIDSLHPIYPKQARWIFSSLRRSHEERAVKNYVVIFGDTTVSRKLILDISDSLVNAVVDGFCVNHDVSIEKLLQARMGDLKLVN